LFSGTDLAESSTKGAVSLPFYQFMTLLLMRNTLTSPHPFLFVAIVSLAATCQLSTMAQSLPEPVVSLALDADRSNDVSTIGEIEYNNVSYVADASGAKDSAALFGGRDTSISIKNPKWGNSLDFTVSFWVRGHDPVGGDHSIISNYVMSSGNGWAVVLDNNNLKSWYFGDVSSVWQGDSGNHVRGLRSNSWYHVTSVFSKFGNFVYLDGNLVKGFDWGDNGHSISSSGEEIIIGRFTDATGSRVLFTKMMLDDLEIYDEPLTPEQVLQHHTKSQPYKIDSDQDGLSDGLENEIGTNTLIPDTDEDGYADQIEHVSGTNPTNPASFPISGFEGLPTILDILDFRSKTVSWLDFQGTLTDKLGNLIPSTGQSSKFVSTRIGSDNRYIKFQDNGFTSADFQIKDQVSLPPNGFTLSFMFYYRKSAGPIKYYPLVEFRNLDESYSAGSKIFVYSGNKGGISIDGSSGLYFILDQDMPAGRRNNSWMHVTLVFERNEWKLFINGVPAEWGHRPPDDYLWDTSADTLSIGNRLGDSWMTVDGLDELMLFSEPLSEYEIFLLNRYHSFSAPERDLDDDGLQDYVEIEVGSDYLIEDTDGDGLLDGYEHQVGTNVLIVDSDRDGLRDGFELQIGTNPLEPDSDGDGYDDGVEHKAGTSPTDLTSLPEILEIYRAIELSFITVEGVEYILQKSSDLQDWEDADEPFTGEGGRMSFFKRAETQEPSFWRLVRQAAE
jgi:hypothetical protein